MNCWRVSLAARMCFVAVAYWPVCAPSALAQSSWQPSSGESRLPDVTPPTAPSPNILPRVPLSESDSTRGLQAGRKVFISSYELTGNTALDDEALAPLLAPYAGREVSYEELSALRDALTRAYIEWGYINSGAVIPPQTLDAGVLEIRIVEGELATTRIDNDGRLNDRYVRERIALGAGVPLNVHALEARLQLLQLDERIDSVSASLSPGAVRGESELDVTVVEAKPWQLHVELNNYESPSVGAVRGEVRLEHLNVSGIGDQVSARVLRSKGVGEVSAHYLVPVSAADTTLAVHARHTRADVIEAPFDELDIETRADSLGVTVRHPLRRSVSGSHTISLSAEYRRSRRFLAGSPFSFSAGAERGVSKVAVVRFGQEWTFRGQREAAALRSTFTVGLDALGATKHEGDVADGQFLAWLGQAQYARRVGWQNALVSARATLQLSSDPLLGLEKVSFGGHASVRGYREGAVVQDSGAYASLEVHVPILRRSVADPRLEVGPFVDVGHAWGNGASADEETLASAGIGVRWSLSDSVDVEGTWALALRDRPGARDSDPQDDGLQFRVSGSF